MPEIDQLGFGKLSVSFRWYGIEMWALSTGKTWSMFMRVFIDESGSHTLENDHIDSLYGVFVLGAIMFSNEEYRRFDRNFKQLKRDLFSTDEFVIHTAEIIRPSKSKNPQNLKFQDSIFRKRFYAKIVDLIKKHSFTITASVIKKKLADGDFHIFPQ